MQVRRGCHSSRAVVTDGCYCHKRREGASEPRSWQLYNLGLATHPPEGQSVKQLWETEKEHSQTEGETKRSSDLSSNSVFRDLDVRFRFKQKARGVQLSGPAQGVTPAFTTVPAPGSPAKWSGELTELHGISFQSSSSPVATISAFPSPSVGYRGRSQLWGSICFSFLVARGGGASVQVSLSLFLQDFHCLVMLWMEHGALRMSGKHPNSGLTPQS